MQTWFKDSPEKILIWSNLSLFVIFALSVTCNRKAYPLFYSKAEHNAGRPLSVDIWYIHWTFIKKKQKKRRRKTSEKKFDVNTRYPRRARWDHQGVLDENSFLYLEFDMNNYLKSWGNYELLWSIAGFVIFIIIYLLVLYGILRCAAMILYANLDFYCIVSYLR